MTLVTGAQLRAARAMVGIGQDLLAAEARVTPTTVRRLEAMDDELRAHRNTIRALQEALENRGIVFLDHDEPGLRMRRRAAA